MTQPPVGLVRQKGHVISISAGRTLSQQIADLAFSYWLARGFRNGSPERDFLRAVMEITFQQHALQARPKLFLVRAGAGR